MELVRWCKARVKDDIEHDWKEVTFIANIPWAIDEYICVQGSDEDDYKAGGVFSFSTWRFCKGHKKTYTKKQIAEILKVPLDSLEIVD